MTSSAQIQAALAAQLEWLESHRRIETPEDVHRNRVATRRIRGIARATRPVVGDVLGSLQDELRWFAGTLGSVRDVDVLLDHLRPEVEALDGDAEGGRLVVAALERQRTVDARAAEKAIGSPRFDALLEGLREAIASMPESAEPLAPLVKRELAKLRRAAAALDGQASDDEVHDLRKRAKRVRYSAELLDGSKWKRTVKALTHVQDVAGAHQDAVQAEERLRSLSRPKTAVAVGRLVERERARKAAQRAALPAALAKAFD